jgi:selenocysteine-specific elongation factor
MRRIVLGTAGHIDHGKTALVRALTGVDTDRLAEEKTRGITIDLGFAELVLEGPGAEEYRIGVVDVPGHEGFVRNMLAGATGMELALLVVSAEEGVMPQTREHVAILDLLGVERVVVALTKVDLADPEWAELVSEEVADLLRGTGFTDAPRILTSSETGEGLDALRAALVEAAGSVGRDAEDLLLLPIDRVFTVKGTGTVVTGTLVSGALEVGASVRLQPGELSARVRGLQNHGVDTERVEAGVRAAVALVGDGIDAESLSRGQAVVAEPRWRASEMLTVRLRVLEGPAWRVAHGQRVRVHLGTAEVMGRVVLLSEGEAIEPSGAGWVQLRLEAPVVARTGMPVVVRSYSPVTTIGGGRVAEAWPGRRRRGSAREAGVADLLEARLSASADARLVAALAAADVRGVAAGALPLETGLPPARAEAAWSVERGRGGVEAADGTRFGSAVAGRVAGDLGEVVDRTHTEEAFRAGAALAALRALAPHDAHSALVDAVLERERAAGRLEVSAGMVHRPGFAPRFTPEQEELGRRLRARYAEAGFAPPRFDDLAAEERENPAFLSLVRRLEAEGVLVELEDDLRIDAATLDAGVEGLRARFGPEEELTLAEFREVMDVSRRHLLPILGWLDRNGVTAFDGQARRLRAPARG